MQVRVDIDDHIDSSEELLVRVEGVVEGSLDRFRGLIARVDVYLSQLRQSGHRDLCCRMEAHAGGLRPIMVSHEALTLTEAIHAASAKLQRAVLALQTRMQPEDASVNAQDDGANPGEGLGHLRSS
jgi:hypothetical protein